MPPIKVWPSYSNSLSTELSIKWEHKCFKENDIFSVKMVVGSACQLSAKKASYIGQVLNKKTSGQNAVSAI